MSVRVKNGRPIIEVYDPRIGDKRYVTQTEIRALGFDPPANVRQARRIEREVLAAQARATDGREETIGAFAERWPDDFRRGKGGRLRRAEPVRPRRRTVGILEVETLLERVQRWARARPLRRASRAPSSPSRPPGRRRDWDAPGPLARRRRSGAA